jgi:YjbE family integral membrane protein
MMAESAPNWLTLAGAVIAPVQILVVDLFLSADNALVIAMACRGLPPEDTRTAAVLGTAGAVGLRLSMAAGVVTLLQIPYLKLVAAIALVGIATRLAATAGADPFSNALAETGDSEASAEYLLKSVATIIVADAIMSLDNIVAVATLANGNLFLLGFGIALSIPLLFWGSVVIRRFLDENPVFVVAGGMFLGWVAGGIGAADPVAQPWIETNAPALSLVIPDSASKKVKFLVGPD